MGEGRRAWIWVLLALCATSALLGCGRERRGRGGSLGSDAGPGGCDAVVDLGSSTSSDGSFSYFGETGGAGIESVDCGGRGGEAVLEYTAPRSGTLLLSTQNPLTELDTVLYVRTRCESASSELACNDDAGIGTRSRLMLDVEAGDVLYVVVDSWEDDGGGEFELTGAFVEPDASGPDGGLDGGRPLCTSPRDLLSVATPEADGTLRVTDRVPSGASTAEGSCGGRGSEIVYRYVPTQTGTLTASTSDSATSFDTVVHVRTTCVDAGSELACDDDSGDSTQSVARGEVVAGIPIYIFVDSFGSGTGLFVLRVRVDAAPDAGFDAGFDGGFDGGFDAGFDGGFDAGFDGGFDAGFDAGFDGGFDAGFDGGIDAGFDGGFDGGFDAGGCPAGWGDCNGLASDGCERNLSNDVDACGDCSISCASAANATRTCSSGVCGFTCNAGWDDCDGLASNGCETQPAGDVDHCGACGNACPTRANATRTCSSGTCGFTCNAGFADCNATETDGCEVDLMSDRNHCGACSDPCPGSQMCCAGACSPSCT